MKTIPKERSVPIPTQRVLSNGDSSHVRSLFPMDVADLAVPLQSLRQKRTRSDDVETESSVWELGPISKWHRKSYKCFHCPRWYAL
jgi:hypothetical protein